MGRRDEWRKVLDSEVKRSEEHTSELQSLRHLVCRLLLEKKKNKKKETTYATTRYKQNRIGRLASTAHLLDRSLSQPIQPSSYYFLSPIFFFFFFNDRAPPEIYPLPLPDALPISENRCGRFSRAARRASTTVVTVDEYAPPSNAANIPPPCPLVSFWIT